MASVLRLLQRLAKSDLIHAIISRMASNGKTPRAPAFFVQHGGGPLPLLGDPGHADMVQYMKDVARKQLVDIQPSAIVLVTAHWEEDVPTISGAETHALLFDYYGFPRESYSYTYNAKGSPAVAERVFTALQGAGLKPKMDLMRGWDHGVFVPMMLMLPEANIPIVQLSVCKDQNAETHVQMGEALAPLRDENIAIIGSGMTFHNMMSLMGRSGPGQAKDNSDFDSQMADVCQMDDFAARRKALVSWREWRQADWSHPPGGAEHWMPMLVVAGAASNSKGTATGRFSMMGYQFSNFVFK